MAQIFDMTLRTLVLLLIVTAQEAEGFYCSKVFQVKNLTNLATVPGFEVPKEIAKLDIRDTKEICKSMPAVGPFRTCSSAGKEYIEYYDGDTFAGQVKFILGDKSTDRIFIDKIYVEENYRGRRISTALLKAVLDNFGGKVFSANLADLNYSATLIEFHAITTPGSPRYIPVLTVGEANKIAVKASPFARSLEALGFELTQAKLVWVTINGPPYVSEIVAEFQRP